MTADLTALTGKDPDSVVAAILAIFRERGGDAYGERVTQSQHAVQAAMAAERGAAAPALVVAALLHDLGHMVIDRPPGTTDDNGDDLHEHIGADVLASLFPRAVSEPVRLHVAAKRYLCTVDPDYFRSLSPASVRSLRAQGGAMSQVEIDLFTANPYFHDAVLLRRFDEAAKVQGMDTAPVERYASLIRSLLTERVTETA